MLTEPVEHLLNRDRVKELVKCQISKKIYQEEAFPSLTLYAHMIQMADGIEVLVSEREAR